MTTYSALAATSVDQRPTNRGDAAPSSTPLEQPPTQGQVDTTALVSEVLAWCRRTKHEPLPEDAVRGANTTDRRLLAALGGFAGALAGKDIRKRLPKSVAQWIDGAPSPPENLVAQVVRNLDSPDDLLARIYEGIISGPRRRHLGTFFTPPTVLAYMKTAIDSHLNSDPSIVVDPGAGVGAFSIAASQWWPKAEVYAVDVNVVTLGLLATRSGADGSRRRHPNFQHADFLSWLDKKYHTLPGPRLIMGNPPYTRHQLLSASDKKQANASCGHLAPGARSGLSTYFLSASLRALAPQDSLCLLLPVNWLEADYARNLRTHLWASRNRRIDLHMFPNNCEVFPGAQVGAMVITVGPERAADQRIMLHQVVGNLTEGFVAKSTTKHLRNRSTPPTFTVGQLEIRETPSRARSNGVHFGHLVDVRRGVATGANNFFLRSDAETQGIPSEFLVPAIIRLRNVNVDTLDKKAHQALGAAGVKRWLLSLTPDDADHPELQQLFSEASNLGIQDRHLCQIRKAWFAVERISAPDILISPMSKTDFRVVTNPVGAIPTNTLYGLRMRSRSSVRKNAVTVAAWLRTAHGQSALKAVARSHGDGLLKLEPSALKLMRVPENLIIQT